MTNAIEINGLCKSYSDFSLDHVSFSLPMGSIMGFIGENGAGKTTTIKAMLNLIRRDDGDTRLLGMDSARDERLLKEQIGVVFDESNFHDNLKTREISSIMRRIYRSWDDALFEKYRKAFQLPAEKTVKDFSRGMKTKLCIAAALAHRPKLLILDEATSGLDPVVRDEILDIFLEFIQDEEHSILLSSHITSDLDKIADYITFIHQGKILFSEGKDDLLDNMGLLRCRTEDLRGLSSAEVLRCRKNQFGAEALVADRRRFCARHPGMVVDRLNLEDIMLFYVRGETL